MQKIRIALRKKSCDDHGKKYLDENDIERTNG